jgi:hypothetical protein
VAQEASDIATLCENDKTRISALDRLAGSAVGKEVLRDRSLKPLPRPQPRQEISELLLRHPENLVRVRPEPTTGSPALIDQSTQQLNFLLLRYLGVACD